MLPEFSLEGRRALVTGAGRGIGQAIALALAEAGADVTLMSRSVDELRGTAEAIRAQGRAAAVSVGDVRSQQACDAAVEACLRELGGLDIVVNSAGTGILKPIVHADGMRFPGWQVATDAESGLTDDDWDLVMDSNFKSVIRMARAAGPHLLEQRSGRFLSVVSCYYDVAPPYHAAYSVSKAALHMLIRCLATEWAPFGVTVNGVAPGNVDTVLNEASLEHPELQEWVDMVPMQRAAQPREIAAVMTFLASRASSFMTGETVVVDGGELSRGLGL